jgi:ribonuclease HI
MMEIYCDGLCEPRNPGGHATWGFVALGEPGSDTYCEVLHEAHGYLGYGEGMTNNVAEYTAVIEALKWAYREGHKGFMLKTDSQLVVNQVNGNWQVKAEGLMPLVTRVRNGMAQCQAAGIMWIPREQNQLADKQSRIAYRKAIGQAEDTTALYANAIRDLDAMDAELADGFELDFVVSNLARVQQYGDTTRFSDKQRAVIARLVLKYLGAEREAELLGQMRLGGIV